MQLNVRGISDVNKFNHICSTIVAFQCSFDVIILTEVKLKTTFPVQLYTFNGFERYVSLRSEKGGGGLIAFIKNTINVEDFETTSAGYEKLKATINVSQNKFRLIAYYRAPVTENANNFLDDLEDEIKSSDIKTFILGDINIHSYTLSISDDEYDSLSLQYKNLLTSYGYSVTNVLPTRVASGRNIDHFATNFHNVYKITNHTIEVDPALTDHNLIISSISKIPNEPANRRQILKNRIDYKKLESNFPEVRTRILASNDPNDIANMLIEALKTAIGNSSKSRSYQIKHPERINDWTSEEAIELILTKDKLLKKHRRKPSNENILEELMMVSVKLDKINKRDYSRYVRNKVRTRNRSKMWRNLNDILGRTKSNSFQPIIKADNTKTDDPKEIANEFNNYFTSCAIELMSASNNENVQLVERQSPNSIVLETPSEDELSAIIDQSKSNSSAGHDGISCKVIKTLKSLLIPLLHHLISVIFTTGIYPSAFKLAVVSPIHKSGSKSCVDNYRPISVLPVLNKIVERVIYNRLFNFVSDKLDIVYSHQFGFRPKSGTENAAIEVANLVMRAIDQKKIVTGVFMDLKKAFDIVDHKKLLQVLENYGIRGPALKILASYLEDRRQIVKVENKLSEEKPITTGVVQGSCLGPLLFIIFINAIGSLQIKGKLFLFADDAVLINVHNKCDNQNDEILRVIQNDMKPILNFFNQRGMILNALKTNYMVFTSSFDKTEFPHEMALTPNLVIKRVRTFKYLGLIIDEHLRWIDHMHGLGKKLAPANGILWKLRNILPHNSKKLVYDTLFQSHLNYMSTLWGLASYKSISNIQILQNRALRNVYDLPYRTHRIDMYLHHVENHLPVRGICLLNVASYVFNVIHSATHANIRFVDGNQSRLRNSTNLRPAAKRTNYGAKSIETFGANAFNSIPPDIKKSRHQHAFKWTLKCHLRNEKFIRSCFDSTFFDLKV